MGSIMTKYFLLVTLFLSTALNLYSQNYKEVKIYLNNNADIQTLVNAGMEFDHLNLNKDNTIDVFIDENDFAILQNSGFNYEVLIDDWYSYYANLPKMTEAEKGQALQEIEQDYGVMGFNYGSMGGFYTLAEVNAELDEMFAQYPTLITQKVSIGTTVEGRPIYMVKISDNPTVNENEPQALYTGLHHAREPESMEQMIFFMFYLLENYGTDPEATYLVNNRELYFIPVLNPDGYQYNYSYNILAAEECGERIALIAVAVITESISIEIMGRIRTGIHLMVVQVYIQVMIRIEELHHSQNLKLQQ